MKVTFKLFASLAKHLPQNAKRNEVQLEIKSGSGIKDLLDAHGVPKEQCHLVLVNGIYVPPGERDNYLLSESDSLAVWPPVAGG